MKKVLIIFAFAAMLVGSFACASEEVNPDSRAGMTRSIVISEE